MEFRAHLVRSVSRGVELLIDPGARERGVLVAFLNRRGGVGRTPYDTLNLAQRVGDDPDDVDVNRRRAAAAVGFDARALVLARQVHGTELLEAARGDEGVIGRADGLVTRTVGPVVGILTADCAPVVLAGEGGVAIVHAGWRGLAAGVLRSGVDAVGPVWGAWVGPSIHACCYEVGPEVVDAFERAGLPVADRGHVDPGVAAGTSLRDLGIPAVAVAGDCTHCSTAYFSYRRAPVTGRQGSFAGLLEG